MNTLWSSVLLLAFTQFVVCRDFYLGMFRRNDFLVAQDVIYKAPSPFGYTTASYGRLFKCPITYFRVVDRLGMGRGPITTIVRGGLKKKYITVRIKSTYRLPVSVNIYVGCENKQPSTFRTTGVTLSTTPSSASSSSSTDGILFVSPDSDTEYSDENGTKNKTTDQTPKEDPDDGDSKKEPDDEKKEDGTDTTPKEDKDENNDETKPEEEEENKPEEEETNPEEEE